VGYIIGPRIASIMTAGGVLSYLVLIPAIKYFGSGWLTPLAPETSKLIRDMSVSDIQKAYVLYIGAGAVAAGGIISLFKSLPVIWKGLKGGLADLRSTRAAVSTRLGPTQDLSMKFVLGGIIALLLAIMVAPQLNLQGNILGALLIVAFGFLFVTVSSRLTGEIGSSSNPISGMTVATLLLTCLMFLVIGWTAPPYFVTALSIGGIVCIAASNGGTTSQDLKTGFLVGSTPKFQQIAILVGALASALVLGPILLTMNQASTVYVPVAGNKDFNFPAGFHFTPDQYVKTGDEPKRDHLQGAQAGVDSNSYYVVHKTTTDNAPPGRYLVNDQGVPMYLADPGINGVYDKLPNSTQTVAKFTAPESDVDVLHHQRHSQRSTSLGPRIAGRNDCNRPRAQRSLIAGICRRHVSAFVIYHADLPRRNGAVGRRPISAGEAGKPEPHGRRNRRQDRSKSRRAAVVWLHRGRNACGRRVQLFEPEQRNDVAVPYI
jgi:hypothetical protein